MATLTNRELVQSYVFTTAKYDFSIDEKRILYRIIEVIQAKTKGIKLNYNYTIQKDVFGDTEFTLPINIFLKDENSKNYEPVKEALKRLRKKDFEYENSEEWAVYGIIERPVIKKYDSLVKITVTPLLLGAFMNFAKGYRKYELKIAMEFKSIYSMRFYELLSGQKKPITLTIQSLKEMFKIEDKYKRPADFINKTIIVAQEELKEKSPYAFEYKINKQGRKYHSITFYPIFQPEKQDDNITQKALNKRISLSWDFSREEKAYLIDTFGFTPKEIKNNLETFKEFKAKRHDLMRFLTDNKRKILDANNPKGYIINSLRNANTTEQKYLF